MSYDLTIRPLKTSKTDIFQTPAMRDGFIEKHPHSAIFSGASGSGKTMLLGNMLTRLEMYKGYFDRIFLFSGSPDDLFDQFDIDKKDIFKSPKKWGAELKKILRTQRKIIEEKGIDKSPRVLVIFEDVQNHQTFLRRSEEITKCFMANRHFGISTWLTGQSWTQTPRKCRVNASVVYFFRGSASEHRLMCEEYCPSSLDHKQMAQLIDYATSEPYSFLSVFKKKKQLRKNLDVILEV